MPNTEQNAALRAAIEAPGATAEVLGAQLLSLLPPLRLHCVSLFDARCNIHWLNEGTLGPDEQSAVEAAIAALTAATTRAHLEVSLSDGRAALFLAVRTPRASLAGVVMALMDARTLSSGNLAARVLTTSMRSVLQKVAIFLAAADLPVENVSDPRPAGTLDAQALEILEPATAEILTVPGTPGDTAAARVAGAQSLVLRELIRLRPGGRTRRYQIVPVAQQQRGDALATLNQLLEWLRHNPGVLTGDPVSFTIGVSAQALADPQLPAALAGALASASQDPATIGFELREAACVTHRLMAERFLAQCEQSRCFAVLDDFTFDTAALDLLRSSAVRLLKVETRLVATALRDKLAQARVVAIAQAAKVLGTHCAAKYVDSPSGRRWLTGIGFDFTLSSVAEPMQRLNEPLSS